MASTLSLAATGAAAPINTTHADAYAIQTAITGTPTGTVKLQVSLDLSIWTDLIDSNGTSSDESITAGLADDGTATIWWTVGKAPHNYVRIYYTRTSGTGTLAYLLCAIEAKKIR